MAAEPGLRVIGIDTSLRRSGVAVIESQGRQLRAVAHGCLPVPARAPLTEALRRIHAGVSDLIRETQPAEAAVEGIFYSRNLRTAVILGEARGAALAACAGAGLPVFEYAPRSVKQAVVGFGGADKLQVARMVMALLGLAAPPDEDAADALAIAICHVQRRSVHAALAPQRI